MSGWVRIDASDDGDEELLNLPRPQFLALMGLVYDRHHSGEPFAPEDGVWRRGTDIKVYAGQAVHVIAANGEVARLR